MSDNEAPMSPIDAIGGARDLLDGIRILFYDAAQSLDMRFEAGEEGSRTHKAHLTVMAHWGVARDLEIAVLALDHAIKIIGGHQKPENPEGEPNEENEAEEIGSSGEGTPPEN